MGERNRMKNQIEVKIKLSDALVSSIDEIVAGSKGCYESREDFILDSIKGAVISWHFD